MPRPPVKLQVRLGRALRRLRAAAGYPQEAFAAAAGVHRTSMGKIERGAFNVTLETLERLAGALGLTAAGLLAEAEREGRRSPAGSDAEPPAN